MLSPDSGPVTKTFTMENTRSPFGFFQAENFQEDACEMKLRYRVLYIF